MAQQIGICESSSPTEKAGDALLPDELSGSSIVTGDDALDLSYVVSRVMPRQQPYRKRDQKDRAARYHDLFRRRTRVVVVPGGKRQLEC